MARVYTFRTSCEVCNDPMVYAAVKIKRFCSSCHWKKKDICNKCGRKILSLPDHEFCQLPPLSTI